jgi:hypothetical protein
LIGSISPASTTSSPPVLHFHRRHNDWATPPVETRHL